MSEELEVQKAIEALARKITENSKPDDAMKYTQAALNLAHALALLHNLNK